MHPGLVLYISLGLCWQLYNFYGNALSERIRETFIEQWNKGPIYRVGNVVVFVVGTLAWPITIGVTTAIGLFFPKTNEKFARHVRRTLIDREGLLTPQMPAARCESCDAPMDRIQVACGKCKVFWDIDHCDKCCDKERCAFEVHGSWTCPPCSPMPVPVCSVHRTPLDYVAAACTVCGKPQPRPVCEKCKVEGVDLFSAGARCFECMMKTVPILESGRVKLERIECLDCAAGFEDDTGLRDDVVVDFEREHERHRMECRLMGGVKARIVGPGWTKEKGSEP